MKIFDPDLLIEMYIYACFNQVGVGLKQTNKNGYSKEVAYFPKKFTEAQKKKKGNISGKFGNKRGCEILATLAQFLV